MLPSIWYRVLLRHAAVLLGGALIGGLYDSIVIGLLVAVFLMLLWHLYNLYLMERWLLAGKQAPWAEGNGLWSQLFSRIQAIYDSRDSHQVKWRRLVKELRASVKVFPDGGVVLGADNEIIRCNRVARRLLGLKKKRDRGIRIDNLLRHPDFVAFLEHGDSQASVEIPAPENPELWLSCRLIPYGIGQKLLLVRDISRIVKVDRMRQNFVANASHELRSPLTVITGYLDSMSDDQSFPGEWRSPLADMQEQTARMEALVNDLMQLSMLESAETSGLDKIVDLPEMLKSAKSEFLSRLGERVSIDLQLSSETRLRGETQEIQSVINNLLSNAIRYTPEAGVITLSWEADKTGGRLSVSDTGVGIPPEDIPRVTERFYRADSGRTRDQGGTGLGLAIVKHILIRHDARLDIQSELGKGSRFTCCFPKKRLAFV